MVEISLSGSGGGHGRATSRGYPTSSYRGAIESDREMRGRHFLSRDARVGMGYFYM